MSIEAGWRRREFSRLRDEGLPVTQIAKMHDLSTDTVRRYLPGFTGKPLKCMQKPKPLLSDGQTAAIWAAVSLLKHAYKNTKDKEYLSTKDILLEEFRGEI